MDGDEGKILETALSALQDHSSEISKLNMIRNECTQLAQHMKTVNDEYHDKIQGNFIIYIRNWRKNKEEICYIREAHSRV